MILRGFSIFYTKFQISRRKRNQIRKYLNPLKKTRGKKSRWTVPLIILENDLFHALPVIYTININFIVLGS